MKLPHQTDLLLIACVITSSNAFSPSIVNQLQKLPRCTSFRRLDSSHLPRGHVSMKLFRDFFKKAQNEVIRSGNGDVVDGDTTEKNVTAQQQNFTSENLTGKVEDLRFQTSSKNSSFEKKENTEETAVMQAERLRAQASCIRLEAEKKQVELTLDKISKLNKKLEQLKSKNSLDSNKQEELEEALKILKNQLATTDNLIVQEKQVGSSSSNVRTSSCGQSDSFSASCPGNKGMEEFDEKMASSSVTALGEQVKRFNEAPEFIQILVAKIAGLGVDETASGSLNGLNATDVLQKLYKDQAQLKNISSHYQDSSEKKATNIEDMIDSELTEKQIQAKVKGLNDTRIALDYLKGDLRKEEKKNNAEGAGLSRLFKEYTEEDVGTFSRFFPGDSANATAWTLSITSSDFSLIMESLYPASTRKEGSAPNEREIKTFINDVLAPTNAFILTGDPISISGGWIMCGKNTCKSGEELVATLDSQISREPRLREKISFFLIKNPFPNFEEQIEDDLEWQEVLFITGPNIARDPTPFIGTLVSAVGIGTAWYASIYPFLLNPRLFDRATEAMELADAGMPTDLTWLFEKSVPLFLVFMTLQATHELAHRAVARSKNFEVTIPTIVPSIISGVTGFITSLKTSPQNKSDLLDFSVSGPLTGMICSIFLLSYGLRLTAIADVDSLQSFPMLPLSFLRQSSLGGGLFDVILGNGVLNVPASAEGTEAVASTLISLHPFAVAGYVSLIVNALSLVPVGRTDGGRISISMFGRTGSEAISFLSLITLLALGLTQSDLLLFYFGYVLLAQNEKEIPLRNEVDDVDSFRASLALFVGFLMLLTLIPM